MPSNLGCTYIDARIPTLKDSVYNMRFAEADGRHAGVDVFEVVVGVGDGLRNGRSVG
jgi:hypothetical protein